MKKLINILAVALFAITVASPIVAMADELPSVLAFTLKSTKGKNEVVKDKIPSLYFKTSVANATVGIDWDNGKGIQYYPLNKAVNTLSSAIKDTLTKDDATIKIYSDELLFINCNNDSIYAVEAGPGASLVYEFRAEYNQIKDFSFFDNMPSLYYVVLTKNLCETLNFVGDKWQRIQLGIMTSLKNLTMKGKNIYEFKAEQTNVETLDLSECPKMYTLSFTKNPLLRKLTFCCDTLGIPTLGNNPKVESLVFKNAPYLKSISFYNDSSLRELVIDNCPKATSITGYGVKLDTLKINNLPALTSIVINNSDIKHFDFKGINALKTLTVYGNTGMDTLDVTPYTNLATLNAYNGEFKAVKWGGNTKLTMIKIYNNFIDFTSLDLCPASCQGKNYFYAPQRSFPNDLPKDVKVGYTMSVAGFTKAFNQPSKIMMCTKFDEEFVEKDGYFSVTDGELKFVKAISDSVRIVVTNELFPAFVPTDSTALATNYVKVTAKDGVDEITDTDVLFSIRNQGSTLYVTGEEGICSIIDATGIKVAEIMLRREEVPVELPSRGIYIIRHNGKSRKIII